MPTARSIVPEALQLCCQRNPLARLSHRERCNDFGVAGRPHLEATGNDFQTELALLKHREKLHHIA